jgi:hypothetical protein
LSYEIFKSIVSHTPPLRHLRLANIHASDASVALAIRAVSKSLESLELKYWTDRDDVGYHQTISAIGTIKFLRRLSLHLQSCGSVSHATLNPLLFGVPPSQPPLCPTILPC